MNVNKAQAARRLGITRNQLYFRLRKYNLDLPTASVGDEARFMPAV